MKKNNSSISSTHRYPSYNIEYCISKALEVYNKETLSPVSRETIAHNLGSNINSGTFDIIFSSMKYYGLLIEKENKTHIINDVIVGKTSAEDFNKKEIIQLIKNPPIYNKILAYYNAEHDLNNLPSSIEIGNMLIKNYNYSQNQAKKFRVVFDKNLDFYNKAQNEIKSESDNSNIDQSKTIEKNNFENKDSFVEHNFGDVNNEEETKSIKQKWDLKNGNVLININYPNDLDEEDREKISNCLLFIREQEFSD